MTTWFHVLKRDLINYVRTPTCKLAVEFRYLCSWHTKFSIFSLCCLMRSEQIVLLCAVFAAAHGFSFPTLNESLACANHSTWTTVRDNFSMRSQLSATTNASFFGVNECIYDDHSMWSLIKLMGKIHLHTEWFHCDELIPHSPNADVAFVVHDPHPLLLGFYDLQLNLWRSSVLRFRSLLHVSVSF